VIIVDTSVWVDHLKSGDRALSGLLENGRVLGHPFVTGEIALGSLSGRMVVLDSLQALPQAVVASIDEVMLFIDSAKLYSIGIGYVDVHLLASARLTPGGLIWTRDRRLREASERLHLDAKLE
jgi:predicted nucleic acid-binding protein